MLLRNKNILCIGGFDPSGAAGLLADNRMASFLGALCQLVLPGRYRGSGCLLATALACILTDTLACAPGTESKPSSTTQDLAWDLAWDVPTAAHLKRDCTLALASVTAWLESAWHFEDGVHLPQCPASGLGPNIEQGPA
jgi:hypothetical protein